jgi:protein SCO1/2
MFCPFGARGGGTRVLSVRALSGRTAVSQLGFSLRRLLQFREGSVLPLLAITLLAGCGKPSQKAGSDSTSISAPPQTYSVTGIVKNVSLKQRQVEIQHQTVPDYMPAMTMPFEVKDTNELTGLQPGDPVIFRLLVTDTDGWIDHIQKRGHTLTNNPPTTGAFRHIRDVEPLQIGDLLPDYQFTNQFGQRFSTSQFKGQALAITFLFTRCPYPTFCPRLANSFAEVQKRLAALPNGATNWHLLTISFDPDFDTPAVLKAYAEMHGYDPSHWTFATGALIDITAIGEQSGLAFWHDPASGSINHNLRTAIIDPAGRVQRIFEGNTWTVEDLTAEMRKALGNS